MEALQAGALTVLEKPVRITNAHYEEMAERRCTQLVIVSQVKLVRQHGNRNPHATKGRLPGGPWSGGPRAFRMLEIVCTTGVPSAPIQELGSLGPDFPLPILLVQRMNSRLPRGVTSWLEKHFTVTVVNDGCVPITGALLVAPAERHLRLEAGRLWLDAGDPVSFQRPSGTVLFQSMTRELGVEAPMPVLGEGTDDWRPGHSPAETTAFLSDKRT